MPSSISPPSYVLAQLGERPTSSRLAHTWDTGVKEIERYRKEHGISDPEQALGPKPRRERESERMAHRAAERRLGERQAKLGRGREAGRARDIGRGLGLGR